MQIHTIPAINKIYLNSFEPLCYTAIGEHAIKQYNHPPYIDASCRREPDLENKFPTISSLCRQSMFAPRLKCNDIIVYVTKKLKFFGDEEANNKLIAILQVDKIFASHQTAYNWFKENDILVPSNCIVDNNPPYEFDHTAGSFKTKKEIKEFLLKNNDDQKRIGQLLIVPWDNKYKIRTTTWKMLVKTNPIYVELRHPIPLFKSDLQYIFGPKIPNTRNPPQITLEHLEKITLYAGIKLTSQ